MDRFPSFLPVFFSAFLIGSSVCWAQNQSDTETPHFEELPAAAPADQAPSASENTAPTVTAPAAPTVQAAVPPVSPTRSTVSKQYQVRIWQTDGECLWRIAEKVYGDRSKWRLIYLANKDIIHDPNKIYPKQRLKIPPVDWQP